MVLNPMIVLVLNCGSSSIKFTLFHGDKALLNRSYERVTHYGSALDEAFGEVGQALPGGLPGVQGVGHRVVHGGARFIRARVVDAEVLEGLRAVARLAPLHNPHNIRGIEFAARRLPGVPQVAVFDTAFHARIPEEAHTYALPGELRRDHEFRRFGFHGISYQFVHRRLFELMGRRSARGLSAILCHLGNGCSAAAVKDGASVDTTMGFTPLEGLVMGTRCGDLDPAVVLQLLERPGPKLTRARAFHLLNSESGLLGLSGLSPDVRDLLEAAGEGHEGAQLALRVFTYRLRKYISAYHGILGGAQALVFTAGIGENAAPVRAQALEGLEPLGFILDRRKNTAMTEGREGEISSVRSRVRIFVIPTDEDRMINREVRHLIGKGVRSPT